MILPMPDEKQAVQEIKKTNARKQEIKQLKGLDNLAPKLINQASKEIDKIAEARIKQVINSGGQQIQKIAPQIIQEAIEDVCKSPFRLLGKLGKQIFSQLKRKLSMIGFLNKNQKILKSNNFKK